MIRLRPMLGAAAGLLAVALAVPLAPATHAADDSPTCAAPTDASADAQNNLQFVPIDLNTSGPSGDATQPIEFQVKNTANGFGPQSPRVESITATLVACRNGQVLPDPPSMSMDKGTSTSMSMAWSAAFTWNREYDVVIEATGRRPTPTGYVNQTLRVVKQLHLAVPPKKPTGVKASTANGVVTITWSNADREPDLIAYEVRRAKQGSSDYATVKDGLVQPTVSSVSDLPGDGAYRYQVLAYRPDVEAGAASSDATAEVSTPAPGAGAAGSAGDGGSAAGADGSSAGGAAGSGGGAGAGGGGKATADKPAITTAGAGGGVDLSHFAAVLNARRSTPTTRVEPPDPGYEETLPFKAASSGDDPAVGEPIEQGSGGGLGQRLIADPEARRRSLGFVAFGLLLFVLGMTGLFVKGEVNRADELEALDGDSAAGDDPFAGGPMDPVAVEADAVPVAAVVAPAVSEVRGRRGRAAAAASEPVTEAVPAASAADEATAALLPRRARRPLRLALLGPDPAELDDFTPADHASNGHEDLRDVLGAADHAGNGHEHTAPSNASHRRRRTVAPLDAPGLDVPDPPRKPVTPNDARRAPSRLPARPADDRRQGRAAVRAGGGGTGQSDRRVPVGR